MKRVIVIIAKLSIFFCGVFFNATLWNFKELTVNDGMIRPAINVTNNRITPMLE
ncbi:MAG: hypothetical protein WCJ92_07395 [Alphaproteobacteria bacterium]